MGLVHDKKKKTNILLTQLNLTSVLASPVPKVLDVELSVLYSLEVCVHCFIRNEELIESHKMPAYFKTRREFSLLRIINLNFGLAY